MRYSDGGSRGTKRCGSEVAALRESIVRGLINRVLSLIGGKAPGATSLRAEIQRWRGATIGKNVWIGWDSIIETGFPQLVRIDDNATLGVRVIIIAHFRETERNVDGPGFSVIIEEGVFVGPGCIILPNVRIGKGAVVCAGSVVTRDVPPMTMVRGNPAVPIALCGIPLTRGTSKAEFGKHRKPLEESAD